MTWGGGATFQIKLCQPGVKLPQTMDLSITIRQPSSPLNKTKKMPTDRNLWIDEKEAWPQEKDS